jgi:hypothetical protein
MRDLSAEIDFPPAGQFQKKIEKNLKTSLARIVVLAIVTPI